MKKNPSLLIYLKNITAVRNGKIGLKPTWCGIGGKEEN